MTTKQTIERYFSALSSKDRWEQHLDDEIRFVSHVTPPKEVSGRSAYVASTRGFYSMIECLKLEGLIVEGDRACAQTRYRLRPPQGETFNCDVSEVFSVKGNKMCRLRFTSTAFPSGGEPSHERRRDAPRRWHVAMACSTRMAIALSVEATKHKRRVLFTRAADLVRQLLEARDARELTRLHQRLLRVDVLLIDELGFVPFDRVGGELLFNLITDRYERRATVVTTNLTFAEWVPCLPATRSSRPPCSIGWPITRR